MVENPLVSVVIPAYNGERFLQQTLASAVAQTYSPIEVVVVDDGSTDQTVSIVEAAATRSDRIRLFRRANAGVAATRNFGISQAQGSLIAPLDADDLWHPEKIARQVEVMRSSPAEVGLVYCWVIDIDEDDFVIPSVKSLGREHAFQGRVTKELATGCFIHTSSAPLIKRSCIDAVGGYDAELRPHGADDWKLYFLLSEICEFAVVRKYLVGYRQPRGSLSRSFAAMGQSMENVAHWIFERRPDLAEHHRYRTMYGIHAFLAQRALDNSQYVGALRHIIKACKAKPSGLLDRWTGELVVRLLARLVGFRRSELRRRGLTAQPRFKEFQSTQHF
jgi:glycosyltransferase involved in cell wall biosynthesis